MAEENRAVVVDPSVTGKLAIQVVLGYTFDHRTGLDHRNGPQSIDRLETDAPISMLQEFCQNLDRSWILKSPKFSDRILAGRRCRNA